MLWVILGSFAVLLAAGSSIAASRDSRRDIESGHPTFDSVADRTGIWNRQALDQLLGPRDALDRYAVTPEQIDRIPKPWWKRIFDNDACDVACIMAALTGPLLFRSHPTLAIVLLVNSATYMVVGYIAAAVVVMRHKS